MANFCPHCGVKTPSAGASFCTECGKPIGAAGTGGFGANWFQLTGLAATAAFLGALVWGFTGITAEGPSSSAPAGVAPMAAPAAAPAAMTMPNSSAPMGLAPGSPGMSTDPAGKSWDVKVEQVTSRFLCGCGNCGDDTVWACDCEHPKGAREVKTFVTGEIQRGQTVPQIIETIKARYGHFIG